MYSTIVLLKSNGVSQGFNDLQEAEDAAVTGDLIIVYPGTYALGAGQLVLKNGINKHWMPGVTISSDHAVATITDNNVACVQRWTGLPTITNSTGTGTTKLIVLQHASSYLDKELTVHEKRKVFVDAAFPDTVSEKGLFKTLQEAIDCAATFNTNSYSIEVTTRGQPLDGTISCAVFPGIDSIIQMDSGKISLHFTDTDGSIGIRFINVISDFIEFTKYEFGAGDPLYGMVFSNCSIDDLLDNDAVGFQGIEVHNSYLRYETAGAWASSVERNSDVASN